MLWFLVSVMDLSNSSSSCCILRIVWQHLQVHRLPHTYRRVSHGCVSCCCSLVSVWVWNCTLSIKQSWFNSFCCVGLYKRQVGLLSRQIKRTTGLHFPSSSPSNRVFIRTSRRKSLNSAGGSAKWYTTSGCVSASRFCYESTFAVIFFITILYNV